jgi:hypothetical protein
MLKITCLFYCLTLLVVCWAAVRPQIWHLTLDYVMKTEHLLFFIIILNLQRFQSKTLRFILNAPRYINNHRIHEDLQNNTVLSEIPNT